MLVSCCDNTKLKYNEIVEIKYSPDNKYMAIKFVRNVSATTPYSYQLTILSADKKIEDNPGNVYICYADFEFEWLNNRELHIITDKETKYRNKVFLQQDEINDVSIKYYAK